MHWAECAVQPQTRRSATLNPTFKLIGEAVTTSTADVREEQSNLRLPASMTGIAKSNTLKPMRCVACKRATALVVPGTAKYDRTGRPFEVELCGDVVRRA